MDDGDNDPARFLAYFVAALQRIGVNSAEVGRIVGRSSQPGSIEVALTAIINDIAAQGNDFIVVLDDYHLINNQTIHHALMFLLDHLPPQMHLVIVTRADLSFPVARLRGRGAASHGTCARDVRRPRAVCIRGRVPDAGAYEWSGESGVRSIGAGGHRGSFGPDAASRG